MSPIPPDPDFRLADSDVAAITAAKEDLRASAEAVRRGISPLTASNEGVGVVRVVEQLHAAAEELSDAADQLWAAEQLHATVAAARDHFRAVTADATVADVEATYVRWQDLRTQLMAADSHHAALYRRQMSEAQARYHSLLELRETAVEDYERAEDAAVAAFTAAVEQQRETPARERAGDADSAAPAPGAATPAPGAATPAPAVPAPAPGAGAGAGDVLVGPGIAPVAPGDPNARLAALPETAAPTAPSGAGGLSPAQAAVLGAALTQQQAAQPGQQAQPQMPAPMMSAPMPQPQQRPPESPFTNAGNPGGLDALLNAIGATAPAALIGPPLSTTTSHAAPAFLTAPVAPPPVFTPLNPAAGGSLSATPAVNPVVTGTSASGLVTDNNVTGRADGAAPRTATSPTHLTGAATDPAAAAAQQRGVGAGGMGSGMMPMMPMVPGAGAGAPGGGEKRDPVTATMTSDQFLLTGEVARAEAVPGGTIAQRKDDAA
jgi:hypothetical protein